MEEEEDAGAEAQVHCLFGAADCNQDASDLCEVNLLADSANCGACGNFCGDARTIETCDRGECKLIACKAPFTICGEGIGCPTNLFEDANNCGGCGIQCDVDAGLGCVKGVCTTVP